jgi:hypothetical protein
LEQLETSIQPIVGEPRIITIHFVDKDRKVVDRKEITLPAPAPNGPGLANATNGEAAEPVKRYRYLVLTLPDRPSSFRVRGSSGGCDPRIVREVSGPA